jgi:tight adherence protein B
MASALMIQRRTGGSLPRTLERLSAVIRDRLSYQRQFKAATGASRISTMLIGLTGPLVTVYLLVWQREYFNTFFETFPGQMMLLTAVLLQLIGYFWIYQLLKNEY